MTVHPVGAVRRADRRPRPRRERRRDHHQATRVELRPRGSRVAVPRVARYLPLSLLLTAAVLVLPAILAAFLAPSGGLLWHLASAALAGLMSLALTSALGAYWERRRASTELLFSDLLLWGFVHRLLVDRRLHEVQRSYELAARNNEVVRIPQLEGLARLLSRRDVYTHGHCQRVASHAERVALAMHLSAPGVAKVRTAALVHDVGKVYTPREILNKPGALTAEEFDVIKRHALDGADMVAAVRDRELELIVRHHHERIDGSGYPDGLKGDEIPLGARIIAVADTFDAVTSRRPYRPARSQREGLALLASERGKQLDAGAVDAFLAGYCPRRSVASFAALAAVFGRLADAWRLGPSLFGAGSSVVAPLAAALGAAGIAAAAHPGPGAAARAARPAHAASSLGARSLAVAHGRLPGSPGAGRPVARRPAHPRADRPGPTRGPGPVAAVPRTASPTAPSASGGARSSPPVQVPVPVSAPSVPVGSPPAGTPPVPVPSPVPVTPPPTPVPPVSTPPVTTPPVSAGSVTVPSVTVPPVHVP